MAPNCTHKVSSALLQPNVNANPHDCLISSFSCAECGLAAWRHGACAQNQVVPTVRRVRSQLKPLPSLPATSSTIIFLLFPQASLLSGPAPSSRLRLFDVIMFFSVRNVSCATIWLVRLCVLPAPTADDAGDASFLGPSQAPTQKLTRGRARARARGPRNANATKHRE